MFDSVKLKYLNKSDVIVTMVIMPIVMSKFDNLKILLCFIANKPVTPVLLFLILNPSLSIFYWFKFFGEKINFCSIISNYRLHRYETQSYNNFYIVFKCNL